MSTKKKDTRPLPEAPQYVLSKCGRLYGPLGQLRPNVPRGCRPRLARYSVVVKGSARHILIRDMMIRVWDIDMIPNADWVEKLRAEVSDAKQDRQACARKRKAARQRAKTNATPPQAEEWRCLPEEPRYELSNMGRMRGPMGLLMPSIKSHGRPSSALYMYSEQRTGKNRGLMIRLAMGKIWDVDFNPTTEWVEKIRAEVSAARAKAAPVKLVEPKPKPKKEAAPDARRCAGCGRVLTAGYWRRCPDCWVKVKGGIDMPLDEYGVLAACGGRRS